MSEDTFFSDPIGGEDDLQPVLIGPYGEGRIPLAIEFVFTLVRILTVIAAVTVTILSILAKASLFMLVLRVLVTILAIGLLGYIASVIVGKYYIDATVDEMKEFGEKASMDTDNESESAHEFSA